MLLIFILIAVFKTVTMVKGVGHVYKYSYSNWPYSSSNTKFVEPPGLLYSQLQVTTGKKVISPDNRIQTKSLSSPN